jgi:hypothetical protein
MLTALVDAGLPYRVFAELADLLETAKPPAPRGARGRWTRWHPYYVEVHLRSPGTTAVHPALWDVAGFRPAGVRAMPAAGTAPDLGTLETMAALRRGPDRS